MHRGRLCCASSLHVCVSSAVRVCRATLRAAAAHLWLHTAAFYVQQGLLEPRLQQSRVSEGPPRLQSLWGTHAGRCVQSGALLSSPMPALWCPRCCLHQADVWPQAVGLRLSVSSLWARDSSASVHSSWPQCKRAETKVCRAGEVPCSSLTSQQVTASTARSRSRIAPARALTRPALPVSACRAEF